MFCSRKQYVPSGRSIKCFAFSPMLKKKHIVYMIKPHESRGEKNVIIIPITHTIWLIFRKIFSLFLRPNASCRFLLFLYFLRANLSHFDIDWTIYQIFPKCKTKQKRARVRLDWHNKLNIWDWGYVIYWAKFNLSMYHQWTSIWTVQKVVSIFKLVVTTTFDSIGKLCKRKKVQTKILSVNIDTQTST